MDKILAIPVLIIIVFVAPLCSEEINIETQKGVELIERYGNNFDNFLVSTVLDNKNIYVYFQGPQKITDESYEFEMNFAKIDRINNMRYPLYVSASIRKKIEDKDKKTAYVGYLQKILLPIPIDEDNMKRHTARDGSFSVILLPRAECSADDKKMHSDSINIFIENYALKEGLHNYLVPITWSSEYVGKDGKPSTRKTPNLEEWFAERNKKYSKMSLRTK